MPSVGKSTVGVILAKILGYSFLDTDLVIQNTENRLLREIIETEGVDGFISTENRIVSKINTQKTVIATGGSIVYGKEAMYNLTQNGTVVYLKLDYDTLESRLSDIKNRGVVIRKGQSLADLFNERIPLYEKYADITVNEKNLTIEQTVSKIIELLGFVL